MTIPWPFVTTIWYWNTDDEPDGEVNPYIRVHEFVHVAQNDKNLFFGVSWVKYLWESVRHISWTSIKRNGLVKACLEAYYDNEYEREAYLIEQKAEETDLPEWAK
jgi:hypothetical protein